MIRIALCDDDPKALSVIAGAVRSVFTDRGYTTEITRFSGGKQLLSQAAETAYDIVMLDIEMPGEDGVDIGKRFKEIRPFAALIYVSDREDRVFDSLSTLPLGFVRKSNFLADLSAVAELYEKSASTVAKDDRMNFFTRTGVITLTLSAIRYIEGSKNYQMIYEVEKTEPTEIKMTMEKLDSELSPYGFIRIHKGFLVNHRHIQRIERNRLLLTDGTELPVSSKRESEVKSRYLSLLS